MLAQDTIKNIILTENRFEADNGLVLEFNSFKQTWTLEGHDFKFHFETFEALFEAFLDASGIDEEEIEMKKKAKKIQLRIKQVETPMLKQMAAQLMDNTQEGSGLVFSFVLDELENRMSEAAFIEFTESL